MLPLAGKYALVTGASRGLGRATALRLARRGATVCLNYARQRQAAESLKSDIESSGGRAIVIQADVGEPDQVRQMIDQFTQEAGPVDILVNNAAQAIRSDLSNFSPRDLETMRKVNVDGVIAAVVAVQDGMKQRGFGRIVNLSSVAAHGTNVPGTTFYAATKAAVVVLTRRFAMELGPFGITVNAVAPGFIPTEGSNSMRSPEEAKVFIGQMAERAMMRCVGTPEDIANAIAFLADPESGFITGQVLTVDGGRLDYIAHP